MRWARQPNAGQIIIEGRDCSALKEKVRTQVRLGKIGFQAFEGPCHRVLTRDQYIVGACHPRKGKDLRCHCAETALGPDAAIR